MKTNKLKIWASVLSFVGSSIASPAVFAENYGITYSGGEDLGTSNVTINEELVDGLFPLIQETPVSLEFSNSTRWQKEGYIKDKAGGCNKVRYTKITSNDNITASDNMSFTVKSGQYKAKVDIVSSSLENFSDPDRNINVAVMVGYSLVYVGWPIYQDSTCSDDHRVEGDDNQGFIRADNTRAFIKMHSELSKGSKRFNKEGIFFGITDIDAAQSYKILNAGNELTKDNMYARSAADLQSPDADDPFRNKFVADGNYIYSSYSTTQYPYALATSKSNIYVPLTMATQEAGVDFVFGFANSYAASAIEYYSRKLNVKYISDENGVISGIKDEKVFPTDNPAGSTSKPNDGYKFVYWVADIDVTLEDGTEIKAGEHLTPEQVKQVVVEKDITFEAIHETTSPAAPDTGASTTEGVSATAISVSVASLVALVIAGFCLANIKREKVDFKK